MIALDTNVLIYACDKANPVRQQIALDLIATTTDAVILWQVACEFVAIEDVFRSAHRVEHAERDRRAGRPPGTQHRHQRYDA